jgi:hypothetical protein
MKNFSVVLGALCALWAYSAVAGTTEDVGNGGNSNGAFTLAPGETATRQGGDSGQANDSCQANDSDQANAWGRGRTAGISADSPGEVDYACACGCGVFDVGTSTMLPHGAGGMAYIEYDYQDQNIDWHGSSRAPAADNGDKRIETNFFDAGLQYYFNRAWGVQVEIPYDDRLFKTTGGATGNEIVSQHWSDLGDIRVHGLYSGFFADQSLGIDFGLKLPTGKWGHNDAYDDVDRDSEIGTGSTDLLLGGYYRNALTVDGSVDWFAQTELDVPMFIRDQYRPGVESDNALGVYLNNMRLGNVKISPIAPVLASIKGHDSGANSANPTASGYERILLSPGVEFHVHPFMVYADVELPVYQSFHGDQLTASWLCKVIVSYNF